MRMMASSSAITTLIVTLRPFSWPRSSKTRRSAVSLALAGHGRRPNARPDDPCSQPTGRSGTNLPHDFQHLGIPIGSADEAVEELVLAQLQAGQLVHDVVAVTPHRIGVLAGVVRLVRRGGRLG